LTARAHREDSTRAQGRGALAAATALLGSFLLAFGTGCTTSAYLVQAGCGQVDIMLRARRIDAVIRDPDTPPRIRALLAHLPAIKTFGERHGLTPTDNYQDYVALDRPAVVWVTTAAEPLRFKSKSWHFPIVGSVPYLGWFAPGDARAFADELREEGWDVDVGQAGAYSTLGWFKDPVLSTMIPDGDEALGELSDVVLHESLHATLYVPNETPFNESVANFVGGELAQRYLDEKLGPASKEKAAYVDEEAREHERTKALAAAYEDLVRLYASALPDEEKRARKAQRFRALEEAIGARRPLNNATLAAFANYNSGGGELNALFTACGESWPRFLGALKGVGPKAFAEPNQKDVGKVVLALAKAGCKAE
jgi:predicted aminopeptidase